VNAQTALLVAALGICWLALLFLTFRSPDAPRLGRLALFQLLLMVSMALAYIFLVKVYKWNPNPLRVDLARWLTKNNMIYLGDFVPGLFDLDYIQRIDTDWSQEEIKEEWLAFYQYDVIEQPDTGTHAGPFGGAIYDYDECRPPAVLSFELVPISYDYLGQNWTSAAVQNIIPYNDPVSGLEDRPEVLIAGLAAGAVTDLNVFRKVGVPLNCLQIQQWQAAHPGEVFPNPLRYENVGSFRGNYRVERNGATVTVVDRNPFERSQITIRRDYRPANGTYFQPGTEVLLDPVEKGLAFAQGRPDNVPQVYYPEKAVLAFYQRLGKDEKSLAEAKGYLSPDAQAIFDIKTDQFGLAMPREDLARVLVWEIRYQPDIEAEQKHQEREVTAVVVGVDKDGNIDREHPCEVTWGVVGLEKAGALPYNCEWRLDWYHTNCMPEIGK
jgi:hypothetical protein